MSVKETLSSRRPFIRRAPPAACLALLWLVVAGPAFAQQTASYTVAGRSMVPTLMPGTRVLVTEKQYTDRPPPHGQLIAIRFKSRPRLMVKRVIAHAGDAIELRAGQLWMNGKRLDEPYLAAPRKLSARSFRLIAAQLGRNAGVVPRGQLVVMGDNPRGGFDSGDYGMISLRQVIGTVVPVAYLFDVPVASVLALEREYRDQMSVPPDMLGEGRADDQDE